MQWFRKWFGRREQRYEADEADDGPRQAVKSIGTARGVPPAARPTGAAAPGTPPGRPSGRRAAGAESRTRPDTSSADAGVDPYNTGSFDRNKAWERVGRR